MEKNITNRRQKTMCHLLCVLVICFIVFAMPLGLGNRLFSSARAETTELPKISVESKIVHRGQTFTLNAYLQKNTGLVAMVLELKYDKTAMSLVGVKRGDALTTHTFTTTNTETEEGYSVEHFKMLWDGTTQDNTTGLLVEFTFESKLSAPVGDYPISLEYDEKNTNSEYGKPTSVDIENGVVTLTTGEFTVVYKNYDGTELLRKDYNAEDVPTYTGETPKRDTDKEYSYVFKGWKGVVSNVKNELWYIAEYSTTPIEYQVLFYVDGEFFDGEIYGYNEVVDLSNVPSKKNYNFSGWFLDEDCTKKVTFQRMPSNDLKLYGYMKYNVREDEIPQITLQLKGVENGVASVSVDVTENPSLAGLVLTLKYDNAGLEFIGFERGSAFSELQFTTTNVENGVFPSDFKFYWESATNTYETGNILLLKFKIKDNASPNNYEVTFTYDEKTDATFVDENSELWYTKLDIVGTSVPIGKIYHWYERTENGTGIDVTTEEGQEPDTVLIVKRITYFVTVDSQKILAAAGENFEIKDIYFVCLMRGEKVVNPNGKITVKIQLTEMQKKCVLVSAYELEENNLISCNSVREEDLVVFDTEKLGEFAIVGDVVTGGTANDSPTNTTIIIVSFALLAVVSMGFILILVAKSKKNKKIFKYPKDKE